MSTTWADTPPKPDEEETFSPYVRGHYGYDSNLFRLNSEQQALSVLGRSRMDESYYSLAAGINANLKVSRQVIKARAELNRTEFDTYDTLDYDGRDLLLQWDWLAGSRLTGNVGVAEKLTQASYANVRQPVSNLVRTRRGFFQGAFKVGSPWQVLFGTERIQTNNDAIAQQAQNATTDSVNTGVQYQTAKGSTLALMSRYTDGHYPNRQLIGTTPVNNDYRQWDNGVVMGWAPSGKTKMAGTLNYTRRNYADLPQRNFSGLTGLLSMDWMVTGKTTLKTEVHRDIGAIDNTTASYTVNNGVSLGVDWNPTAKLALNTRLRYDSIDFSGDPAPTLAGRSAREDQLTTMQAGVEYAVLRNTQLGLFLQRGIRRSSEPLSAYDYNSAHLTVRSQF
ncbi:MAG: outer membrane beta-barrel protein [Thiobacillus sp.]|nr:outer membrane beta-barrel protein [Thiobacillus sp.]